MNKRCPLQSPSNLPRDLSQGKPNQTAPALRGLFLGPDTPPLPVRSAVSGPWDLASSAARGPLLKEDGLVPPPGDPQSPVSLITGPATLGGQPYPPCLQDCELWEDGNHIRLSHMPGESPWTEEPGGLQSMGLQKSSSGNPPASADHGGALGSTECPEAGQPPSNT